MKRLKTQDDSVIKAACWYSLGEIYMVIGRPRHARIAYSNCRESYEELASKNQAGSETWKSGLATAMCKEGLAAYSCGDLHAAGRMLLSLISNYAPSSVNDVQQGCEAYIALGRTQMLKGNVAGAVNTFGCALGLASGASNRLQEGLVTVAIAEFYRLVSTHVPKLF